MIKHNLSASVLLLLLFQYGILLLCTYLHRTALLLTRKWQFGERILDRLGVVDFHIWLIL